MTEAPGMITAAEIQEIRNNDPDAILPGIDTMTGNPYAASSLLDVTKITQNSKAAPYYYSPKANIVYVTQAGAVLSGINFGDAMVVINANNVTIKDCTFTGTSSFWAVTQSPAYSGATVENCTFTGSKSPTEINVWISSNLAITIKDNTFLNSPADAIAIRAGVITGNYFSGEGYAPGAHGDAIFVTESTGPVSITDNFIDETPNADAPGAANSDIRITNEFGNADNVTVSGNYLLGAGYTVEVGSANTPYTISNVSIANNDVGFGLYAPYSPTTSTLATVTGTTIVDFSNPTASTQAQAAYLAAGVPKTTVLGNGVALAHLGALSGETNFDGGFGAQYLLGGQGANILTYLAIGEGGDTVSAFDPAKDVIDLSRIDADITTDGVQSFTFIGDAPFSGGAQVRYQFTAKGTTVVQAALAGDTTADFTITLASGLTPLTAANFALTPSQSSADLANGVALSFKKVTTVAGAPTEYAYTNVQGKAYTSYESFAGSTYGNVAADDLNLSSSANELVLYDPTQTVTRGGGAETLQVAGMGSDPLTYHPVETIDATTSGGEQFIFSAGFGKETINGFNASGASPDSIQLATSAFSYLTPGMTQAQDLAAVLSQATRGASGLTISDTHGDSLTIAGLTPSMLAVNPAVLHFT
jgi:Right handed beta helix region